MGYTRQDAEPPGHSRADSIRKVLLTVLAFNLAVALAKLTWGYLSGSLAMVADGWHSMFDGVSNLVGLVGIAVASRPADRNHPYGHAKYETWASVAIGAMLALAAWHIATTAIERLWSAGAPPEVSKFSFVVMLVTLTINIIVTLYERRAARRLMSDLLQADSSHTASDVFVSIGVICGLVAVALGYPIADPIIALVVAAIIAKTAFAIVRQATDTLSDVARIDESEIAAIVASVDGVLGSHHIRTRGVASAIHVDLHVQVDAQMTVMTGHAVAEDVERKICSAFSNVADVIVHLEPMDEYQRAKSLEESREGAR